MKLAKILGPATPRSFREQCYLDRERGEKKKLDIEEMVTKVVRAATQRHTLPLAVRLQPPVSAAMC